MRGPEGPLRISLIQGDTRWQDAAANRAYYGELARPLAGSTDLVLLPETFTTGFTNAVEGQAEPMDGPSLAWMAALAADTGAAVAGSLLVQDGGAYRNRLVWMRPDGAFEHYDKRHLFRMAREHERFSGGAARLVVELRGWRICPLVCYDLRFPVWSRNRADAEGRLDYDLLLYVANWPTPRRGPWRTLLRARAIENLCYVAGVNRVGLDGGGHPYSGDSAVVDFQGEPLVELGESAAVATAVLDPEALAEHRRRFPAWMDADDFTLRTP